MLIWYKIVIVGNFIAERKPVAHFTFDLNPDGSISQIYKDGEPFETGTRLEMPTVIVQTYFKSALRNLHQMTASDEDRDENRQYGLQCFLMSLVGTEAFINVFFHLVGRERDLPAVIDLANSDKTTIEHKISHLPRQAYGNPLVAQKRINKKMRELYDMRSKIVHPKWQPSSFAMPGLHIDGLVENEQNLFEDPDFCRETLQWCLLVVARVGIHANGCDQNDWFVKYWTSLTDTNASLSEALAIPPGGA